MSCFGFFLFEAHESLSSKSLFLLCSLFLEDDKIEVETLVQYGMGLRLFQDVNTIQDGRVRARALVSTLLSSFLLLKAENDDSIKMHDLVRDTAILISSEENKYMVKAGAGLRDWPNPETISQTYTGTSLMSNDIRGKEQNFVSFRAKQSKHFGFGRHRSETRKEFRNSNSLTEIRFFRFVSYKTTMIRMKQTHMLKRDLTVEKKNKNKKRKRRRHTWSSTTEKEEEEKKTP